MTIFISSEFPFNSGAYIADARAGKALNCPGISARSRYAVSCLYSTLCPGKDACGAVH